MPGTLDDLLMTSAPTAERPLLGIMILVVEDSRLACDALRLICQRSGARIRRAESLASATRHLRTYLPRVAVVDLGLPDGSGLSLISQLSRSEPRIDAIIAMSGDDTQADAAIEAGADVFLAKPVSSISSFQSTVLRLLPRDSQPPRVSLPAADQVDPDPVALRDDLALAVDLLGAGPDGPDARLRGRLPAQPCPNRGRPRPGRSGTRRRGAQQRCCGPRLAAKDGRPDSRADGLARNRMTMMPRNRLPAALCSPNVPLVNDRLTDHHVGYGAGRIARP